MKSFFFIISGTKDICNFKYHALIYCFPLKIFIERKYLDQQSFFNRVYQINYSTEFNYQ